MYSAIEKAQTASVPDAGRDKVINHIKENVTPEIISKMISAGLKRNFTIPEIIELAKNDDSELSKDLKQKIDIFRYEVSSEIKLLIAALNG